MRKGGFFKQEKPPSERILGWCSLFSGIVILIWMLTLNIPLSHVWYWLPLNLIGWWFIGHGLKEALD